MMKGKMKFRRFLAGALSTLMLLGGTITSQAAHFDTRPYTQVAAGNLYHNGTTNQTELDDLSTYYNCFPMSVKNYLISNGIKIYLRSDESRNGALARAYSPSVVRKKNTYQIVEPGYIVYYSNSKDYVNTTSVVHEVGHQLDYYAAIAKNKYGYGISDTAEWKNLYLTYGYQMLKIDNLTRTNVKISNREAWAEMVRILYVDPDSIIRISPDIYNYMVATITALVGADATPIQKAGESRSIDNFDYVKYADTYADLKAVFGYDKQALYNHYIQCGMAEGRQASFGTSSTPVVTYTTTESKAGFDHVNYADTYPDLKAVYGYDKEQLWNHYKKYGKAEGRVARFTQSVGNTTGNYDSFDHVFYADANPDIRAALGYDKKSLWNHYRKYGKNEGRSVRFS